MALLYRFTKLNDRFNTGIFTFIVTRSVTRDLHRDATTKDFYYGYHRWAISFTRANDRALGVFLILRNPSPSTKCYADFTLTLLNREHFSRNEQHQEKQCKFTTEHTTQGVNKWIMMNEIQSRKFGDETGEFLLELSIGNIMTIFETDLQISTNGHIKSGKFESASFTFGSFEWNISIVIHNYGTTTLLTTSASTTNNNNNSNNNDNSTTSASTTISNRIIYVFLNRLSGFDHPCRVQYRVIIGLDEQKNHEDSGVLDQISDAGGRIRGFQMQHSLSDLIKSNGTVRIYVELHCCNAISEAKVPIMRNPSPTINCYDRNKQGWCIEADLDSEYLRLKLFFMDLHSVPRNHLRYISWIAYVIAKDPRHGIRESISVSNAPHSNYYVQDGIDMGAMMDTTLLVSKIKESPKVYLENEKLTVHVEWCDSIMLFNHIYHKYDDITRIHGHQMRREIIALSNENYSLEKQLISYQKTIGHTVQTRSLSKDSSKDIVDKQQQQQQQKHSHHHHHHHHNQQQQQHHKHHITGQRRSSSEIQLNVEHLNKINNQLSLTAINQQQQQQHQNIQRNDHLQNETMLTIPQQQQQLAINSRNIQSKQQQSVYSHHHQHHHHKLPTISTNQQHSATPPPSSSSSSSLQSQYQNSSMYPTSSMMIPNSPKFNALRKSSLTHYGSLPKNSSLSFDQISSTSSVKFFYSEDQGDYIAGSNLTTNTPPPPPTQPSQPSSSTIPRLLSTIVATQRSLHRSRERNYQSSSSSSSSSATAAAAASVLPFSSIASSIPLSIQQTSPYGNNNNNNNIENGNNINGFLQQSYNTLDNDELNYRAQISPSLQSTQQQQQFLQHSSLRQHHYHQQQHFSHQQYGANRFINPTVIIDNENCNVIPQQQQQQQTSSSAAAVVTAAAAAIAPTTIQTNLPIITMNENDYNTGYTITQQQQPGINYQ